MVSIKRNLIMILVVFALCLCGASVKASTSNDNKKQQDTDINYIKGRPLTEKEIEEQKKHEPKNLKKIDDRHRLQMSKYKGTSLDKRVEKIEYESKYDARKKNLITKVKDQGCAGWCWSYATTACMETSMIKNGIKVNGKKSTVNNTDLSEASLVYYFYNRTCTPDPLGGSLKDENKYNTKYDNGARNLMDYAGKPEMAGQFLTTWMGAKPESYYSVDTSKYGSVKKPNIKKAYTDNAAIIKNVYYIYQSKNHIKKAVKDYGAVAVDISWDPIYMNYHTAAYCYQYSDDAPGHSVMVVGWDDNYSYKNFTPDSNVKTNGAWIVKNSWSSSWGDKGYFYISYEDADLYPTCALEMQEAGTYTHNYFYDGASGSDWASIRNGDMAANVFETHGNQKGGEILKAVSFGSDDSDIGYSIQIYTGLRDPANPKSGTAALSKPVTGITTYPGVYTVPLKKDIMLTEGQQFSVVITFTSKEQQYIFIECEGADNLGWIEFKASTHKNQSFLGSKKTGKWTDLSVTDKRCARIKAYTNNRNVKTYKVQFKDGKKTINTQYIEKGQAAVPPKAAKNGYTFVKWVGSYTNIQRDVVINSVWKVNNYTINFNANCGKNSMKTMYCTYDIATILRTNKFTRSGFTFVGWASDKKGKSPWYQSKAKVKNLTGKKDGKVTLYAQWSREIKIDSIKSPKSKSLSITYQKTDSYQTGYQILYSTNKNFKGAKTITVKGYKNASKTITKLSSRKRYYVKVRTYRTIGKTNYYGKYCGYRSVVVK